MVLNIWLWMFIADWLVLRMLKCWPFSYHINPTFLFSVHLSSGHKRCHWEPLIRCLMTWVSWVYDSFALIFFSLFCICFMFTDINYFFRSVLARWWWPTSLISSPQYLRYWAKPEWDNGFSSPTAGRTPNGRTSKMSNGNIKTVTTVTSADITNN